MDKTESQVTKYSEACCSQKYRRANYTCFILAFLNQFTGLHIFVLYSNAIINGFGFPSTFITGLFGITNIIGVLLSIYMIHKVGRKTLLCLGYLSMGLTMVLTGIFFHTKNQYGLLISVLVFVFSFATSSGPLTWIYMAEVMDDKGLSIGSFLL